MTKRGTATKCILMALGVAACSSTAGSGPGPGEPTPATGSAARETTPAAARPGPYTLEQAARGEQTFQDACSRCHRPSEFSGTAFIPWRRLPLGMLAEFMRANMPRGNPGSLSRQQYADIVAYMLALNDIAAGPSELPPDLASLRQIRVEEPPR